MSLDPLLEHYRVPESECAAEDGSTLWRRRRDPLGRGAYGEVWLEENVSEGKLRAVKTVRNPTLTRSHINNEVFALVNLSQRRYRPYFGEFMGFFEDGASISFFMEYFPQRDLRKHLPEGAALPEDQAKTITQQILRGVQAMHEQNFTHRDLKPENIFIVSRYPWRVKIGDFGVAKKIIEGGSHLGTKVGTEQYMAPEIFCFVNEADRSPGKYSSFVDIWSVGVMLFELLTGERPFPTHAKLKAYCDGRYGFPDSSLKLNSVTSVGATLTRTLLAAQPVYRLTAQDALGDLWFDDGASGDQVRPRALRTSPQMASSPFMANRSRASSSPRTAYMFDNNQHLSSMASQPPAKPLPEPPQSYASRSSSTRFRDEGYHTGSDKDIQEMIDTTPPPLSPKSEKRSTRRRGDSNDWIPADNYLMSEQSANATPRSNPRSSPSIASSKVSHSEGRSMITRDAAGFPIPPTSDPTSGLVRHESTTSHYSAMPYRTQPTSNNHSDSPRMTPGTTWDSPRMRSKVSTDTPRLGSRHPTESHSSISSSNVTPQLRSSPAPAEESEDDVVGPLAPQTPTFDHARPRTASRSASHRSESVLSMVSGTSSTGEVRESITQLIRDGQWKLNDVIVLCQVSNWDLVRISAHSIKKVEQVIFQENLHKNYINELPKLIFDALKPWFAENLGINGSGKPLLKDETTYQQRIRDDILPYVDVMSNEPEFFKLQLPKSLEVIDISRNIEGGVLRVPSSVVIKTIKDHWRLYIEEYINGFIRNDRATGKGRVRAIVFDESPIAYARHEEFYHSRLEPKLFSDIEYANFEGFRRFVDKTSKIKDESAKKSGGLKSLKPWKSRKA